MRLLFLAVLLLTGCARWESDPVYQANPPEIPVTTFAIFPF